MSRVVTCRLVVALRCEAQPLIERFDLCPRESGGRLRCFVGALDDTPLELAISGVGKLAAATATAYLQGSGGTARARWLNIGLAGHGRRAVGEALLAGRVEEASSGRFFRVEQPFDSALPVIHLRTVDTLQPTYPEGDVAVEMEAYGFFAAARRFANAKAVHALKVVSDNAQSPPLGRDEARATRLIEGAMEAIVETITKLSRLSQGAEDDD